MPLLPVLATVDHVTLFWSVTWPLSLMWYRLTYPGAGFDLNLSALIWTLTVTSGDTVWLPPTLLTVPLLDWLRLERLSLIIASIFSKWFPPGCEHCTHGTLTVGILPNSLSVIWRCGSAKTLLAKGPICLQETKWSASEKEVLMQHIPGLQIAESSATRTPSGHGGVAVLVPPGYVLKESQELVKGRAVAALIADRTSQYYIVSVYLHPDRVRQDLAALLRAVEGLNRADTRIILTGGFNRADERCTGEWSSFLEALQVFDVFPSLGTYRHPRGLSPLDRCLVPNDWVSSARWNPALCAIEPRGAQGHLILKLHVRLKPCVLNNPFDPKHVTIPSNTFMPGKDGAVPRDISSLYGLVRLLHRQHFELFAALPPRDGFVLQDARHTNERTSFPDYVIPNRSDDSSVHFFQCNLQVGELAPSRRQTHTTNVVTAAAPCHSADIATHHSVEAVTEAVSPRYVEQSCEENPPMTTCLTNAYLSNASCYWTWWRSVPSEQPPQYEVSLLESKEISAYYWSVGQRCTGCFTRSGPSFQRGSASNCGLTSGH